MYARPQPGLPPEVGERDVMGLELVVPAWAPITVEQRQLGFYLTGRDIVRVANRPYPRINDHRTTYACCEHCAHIDLVPHPVPCWQCLGLTDPTEVHRLERYPDSVAEQPDPPDPGETP